jgi:membrane fusion protein (multidrug efflux system)
MKNNSVSSPRFKPAAIAKHLSTSSWKTLTVAGITLMGVSCKKPEVVAPPPPIVEVMELKVSEVPLNTTLIGQLDSPQNVEIRARVEGFVDQMPFTEGVEIKQGDLLFSLDKKPFLERLAAANGMLAEAEASLRKYEADVARLEPLYQKSAIPKQDLDNAKAGVEVGLAGLESAKARVQTAQLDLSYCEIKAPISGLIGAKMVALGELVGKGEPTLLATISTLDPIWFYCNVSEVDYLRSVEKSKELGRAIESLPLSLILSDGKEHPDKGKFVFIDRAVDVKTGTLRVRAEFPNKEKNLRPGMFARARVDLGTRKDCIEIPQRALSELQGKNFVWVISPDNTASQRQVKVGELSNSNIVILDGLKIGERIVVEGLQKVREKMLVNPMNATQMAAMKSTAAAAEKPEKH